MTVESRPAQLNRAAPRRIQVQAALWIADLHGPDRNVEMEERLRRWIAEDPRHAAAFELANGAWQRSGDLPGGRSRFSLESAAPRGRVRFLAPAVAGAAILCGILITTVLYLTAGAVVTSAGEQRTVELSDGSQVALNVNSKLVIQYDEQARKVALASGEALFTVKKHQSRPFIVVIGGRKIIALGTSFVVRRDQPDRPDFAVTLIEGRVAVEPLAAPDDLPADSSAVNVLNPGQRLRYEGDGEGEARVDSPSVDKMTAWRRGELIFDDTSLGEAAAEFNRYGRKLVLVDTAIGKRFRVGGVFRIGDPESFALAMANAHHLQIVNRGREIILSEEKNGQDEK